MEVIVFLLGLSLMLYPFKLIARCGVIIPYSVFWLRHQLFKKRLNCGLYSQHSHRDFDSQYPGTEIEKFLKSIPGTENYKEIRFDSDKDLMESFIKLCYHLGYEIEIKQVENKDIEEGRWMK